MAAVDGGFLSVANNEVRLLCQHAEISFESNYDEAKRLLDERVAAQENERRLTGAAGGGGTDAAVAAAA